MGAARKPTTPLGVSHGEARKPTTPLGLLHGEARKPTTLPGLLHGEVRKPTVPPGLLHGEAGKTTAPPGVCHGEAGKPTAPPGLLHGEAGKPTTPPGLLRGEAAKPTAPPGLLRGEARKPTTAVAFAWSGAFPAARPVGTTHFLITRGKASFYETATFRRRKVLFSSPFCGLLFGPGRAKLTVPAGKSPPPKPRPPLWRLTPNDRDRLPVFAPPARTPAPATPPQSACSRRLSGCPPKTEPFRPAPSGKPERERKRKGGSPMPRPPPGLTRPLRLKMAGRAPSRNTSAVPVPQSVAESPQSFNRRSAP